MDVNTMQWVFCACYLLLYQCIIFVAVKQCNHSIGIHWGNNVANSTFFPKAEKILPLYFLRMNMKAI